MQVSNNPDSSSSEARTLVVEIGTEELPPKALKSLSEAFSESVGTALKNAGMLDDENLSWHAYASPRRIAVKIERVLSIQPDLTQQRKGPSLTAAFSPDGSPTPAAIGFARACGVEVNDLETEKTEKGAWLIHVQSIPGKTLDQVMFGVMHDAVRKLPIPKRMRWGDCEHEFVRPVHWLLALHGDKVLDFSVLGLNAGRITYGHRFHASQGLSVGAAEHYADELEQQGFVLVDYEARQSSIQQQIDRIAERDGLKALMDPDLLDEVVGLTEWPVALQGSFDERFLKLPREVLIETMASHQKYVCLTDRTDRLTARFIVVINLDSQDPDRVRKGNERVLGARLADAEFFWNTDQKIPLTDRFERLKTVVFHNQLGSIFDKSHRIIELARRISDQLGLDAQTTEQAARLCKTDLVTEMVAEFPKLQGVAGHHYGLAQGVDPEVARAIEAHYLPRFSGDKLPPAGIASSVAIADRIDTLCGIFACGDTPSGERDPFSLRRASLGVLRILMENRIDLDLRVLIDWGMDLLTEQGWHKIDTGKAVRGELIKFILERSRQLMQSKGYEVDLWRAAMEKTPTRPLDFVERVASIQKLVREERDVAESIIAINKRISNILQQPPVGSISAKDIDMSLIKHESERQLVNALIESESSVLKDKHEGRYAQTFHSLFKICPDIDSFFDNVLVNADDPEVRKNRMTMLQAIRSIFLEVADFSQIRMENHEEK